MLTAAGTALVLIDVQGKLAQAMYNREELTSNLARLVRGAQALALPILCTEQNPGRMGPTIPELATLLPDVQPIAKMAFGCAGEPAFMRALEATRRRQVLLCGIEAHVCVFQTAAQLVARGYGVQVVADATGSRTDANHRLGLDRSRHAGAAITGVESALFEAMESATHPAFRTILQLVK